MAAGAVSAPQIIPIIQPSDHRVRNINTETPVTIQSDSAGVSLFFTLDGSKPITTERGSMTASRKYSEPIRLPAGRVTVRAVAVNRAGQPSSMVTKVFLVDLMENSVQKAEQVNRTASASSVSPAEQNILGDGSLPLSPHSLIPLRGSSSSAHPKLHQPMSFKQNRTQKNIDCLWCPQCLSVRPTDPTAQFCAQCGTHDRPSLLQRLPPVDRPQGVWCVLCHSVVPNKTGNCLICDASIEPHIQIPAAHKQQHVLCVSCGSGNPGNVSSCVTCETRLQPVECAHTHSAPSGRRSSPVCCECVSSMGLRSRCGSKVCWGCGANGCPSALYCTSCGVYLLVLPTNKNDITQLAASQLRLSVQTPPSDSIPQEKVAPRTVDRSTQTTGQQYPSGPWPFSKEQHRASLSTISPGRGYWRKQVDHVCAQLRSFTQNNAPFRTLLGEPRMGQLLSAVITEDTDEVNLTVSFKSGQSPLVSVKDSMGGASASRGRALGQTMSLSSITE